MHRKPAASRLWVDKSGIPRSRKRRSGRRSKRFDVIRLPGRMRESGCARKSGCVDGASPIDCCGSILGSAGNRRRGCRVRRSGRVRRLGQTRRRVGGRDGSVRRRAHLQPPQPFAQRTHIATPTRRNSSSTSCLPCAPTSSIGPTQAGQPLKQAHVEMSRPASRSSSSYTSNSLSLKPTPPG